MLNKSLTVVILVTDSDRLFSSLYSSNYFNKCLRFFCKRIKTKWDPGDFKSLTHAKAQLDE